MRSVQLLRQAGVDDAAWLHAVLHHHEQEDGSGYPAGDTDAGDLATLARRADVYTSKLASRSGRDALAADLAGRQMFMQGPRPPHDGRAGARIRPSTRRVVMCGWCRGELAIVVQRGAGITTPWWCA